jgi:hypothetical protein
MANPTSNFNWQMPTASDLVTDLPADFEVFGQAVDTSLADLKGGTTDQVLAKNSNTDMDFKWVTSDDANAIQNSIVDAKGDLIAATAADTPARLAVGTNGQVLTADSTAATGIKWATPASGTPAYVGASVYKSANQSITTATVTAVTWDAEIFDTNAFHDNATNNNRFTIPSGYGGKYLITVGLAWGSNVTGERTTNIRKNGSTYVGYSTDDSSAGYQSNPLATVLSLNAADYIELLVYQTSGGNVNVSGGGIGEAFWQITYLGA